MILKFIYKIALLVIFPLVFIYCIIQSIVQKDFNFFKNKFGFIFKVKNNENICIHCVSLGEINGAKKIIEEINKKNNILISTNTISGKKRAQELFPNIDVLYFPFDYRYIVSRWLRSTKIKNILIYETEIWPNFYNVCNELNVRICVLNARISKDVLETEILKEFYKEALNKCTLILCKSGYEKEKYIKLGVNEKLLFAIGNLKYSYIPDFSDELSDKRNEKLFDNNQKKIFDIEMDSKNFGPYWRLKTKLHQSHKHGYFLMASTHEPDEKYFLQGIKGLFHKGTITIVAPRHISRSRKVYKFFKKNGISVYLLSELAKSESYLNETFSGVLVIDTYGDLPKFYSGSRYVYVGGGYSKRGVQNVIEPSTYGKPILVGPNIDNFYEEIVNLRKDKGITVIDDNKWIPVQENIARHLKEFDDLDNDTLDKMGGFAKVYTLKFNDIIEKYVKSLKEENIIN
tara:strand:+ start:54 stop:1427 length:1374 start_codon:yes stop_codon:yes gene_type:complete